MPELPSGDVIAHEADDCPCQPTVMPVPDADGSMNYVVIHNAWDGRA